jgi:hypothetical protein
MKKILFIYTKKETLKLENYKDIINTIFSTDNLSLSNSYFNHNSIFIVYGNESENILIYSKENLIISYAGFIYFDLVPISDKNIEQEIFENILKNLSKKDFSRIKGKYIIANYTTSKEEWTFFNDILGFWPTYFYQDDNIFLLSNDFEPLVKYKNNRFNLNIDSIYEYILFGAPQNNKTLFKNIQLLPPNSLVKIKNNKITIKNYIKPIKIKSLNDSIEEIADNYYFTFKKETNQILNWKKDPKICLTGGTDTRMILGVLDEKNIKKSNFVTWSSEFFEDEINQDIIIAKILAKEFGLKHNVIKNDLFAFKELNEQYFVKLRESTEYYIGGYLGSETLRFFHSYTTNISYLTRLLINTDINYDSYNDLFYELKFKSKKESILNYINYIKKYLRNNSNKSLKYLIEEINNSYKHIRVPYSEISYMVNYCSRSFFSRHCGGARNNILLTNNVTKFILSPFMSIDLLKIIFEIKPKFLNHYSNGLSNIILKKYFKHLNNIYTNSHLADCPATLLKKITFGQKSTDVAKLNYQNAYKIIKSNNLNEFEDFFDFHKIIADFSDKDNVYVWYDLFIFLNYVKNL